MATPAKAPAAPVMEQSMEEFGVVLRKLNNDVKLLIGGDGSKYDDVIMDIGEVWGGVREFILGLSAPPMVGSAEKLASCKGDCAAECDSIMALVAAEKPRYVNAGAGGSLTEGAKIDRLLAILEKLAPLLKLFFI